MRKKRVLVCGTGFGKIYLKAIAKSEDYILAGIMGRGSDRTKNLAKNLKVPFYTSIDEINTAEIDAVCVVVPNASGGGNGAEIAEKMLLRGVPTLLEHPAHEHEIVRCLRVANTTPFMLNSFYRYIKPVQTFLETASLIRKHSKLLNASMDCAIDVLYDGLDILGLAIDGLSAWKIGSIAELPMAWCGGNGTKSVGISINSVPVMLTINTNIDRNDPDHPLHLYHRIELTFSTGRLCLVNTHGPIIWMPFLRMPRDKYGEMKINMGSLKDIPSAMSIGEIEPPSMEQTLNSIWPEGVVNALKCLLTQDKEKKMQMAQYQIFVSRLWSEICRKVGYTNIVDIDSTGDVREIYNILQESGLININ